MTPTPQTMVVLLFAQARELARAAAVAVDAETGMTVDQLRSRLAKRHPELADLLRWSAVAVNSQYSGDECVIPDGAEVAVIPPVSGG